MKKKIIGTLVITAGLVPASIAAVIYFGLISVAADEPHAAPVTALLEKARNRSIAVRVDSIDVPDLGDTARIQAGSGNYAAMCASCHLAPGQASTELSQGLYPEPPNLTQTGLQGNPARTFWVVKHGIKGTGMPAWGKSIDDRYIWDMVAFLQQLPSLDAEQYQSMVRASGGHQHGGGETDGHGGHDHGGTSESGHSGRHHVESGGGRGISTKTSTHIHPDGKEHVHEH
jgi:mono/diheme cytochrome c family protein